MDDRIEELKQIIHNDPTNFQAMRELACELMDIGENENAMKALNYLIKIFPDEANLYYNMGIVYEKLREDDKAVECYQTAMRLEPDDANYMYNLACAYVTKKEYENAKVLFQKVLNIDTEDSNTMFHLGMINSRQNNSEEAIKYLENTIAINPEDTIARFYLAYEYKRMGRRDEALAEYKKVTEQAPDYSWAYFNMASIYWEEEDVLNAVENLDKTVDLNPHDTKAFELFIKILMKTDTDQGAIAVAKKAIKENPDCGDLYYTLAQVYKKVKDLKNYIDCLKSALEHQSTLSISTKEIRQEINSFK